MPEVIFSRKTAPTGRALQRRLEEEAPLSTIVVNWTGAPLEGALNGNTRTNKLSQLEELDAAGVLVPAFSPASTTFPNIAPFPGWLPRTNFHARAGDFRRRPRADYWVEPLLLSEEKRIHVFRRPKGTYVSIRTAVKVPSPGQEAHPWVRSHETGWRFSYRGAGSNAAERKAAISAVEVLNLDFGAVDIGTFCGHPVVLEVNTCPGLDGGQTIDRYVREILKHDNA